MRVMSNDFWQMDQQRRETSDGFKFVNPLEIFNEHFLAGEDEVNVRDWFCLHCAAQYVQLNVSSQIYCSV